MVKEHQKHSYRGIEALLRDSEPWLRDIGLRRAPDHNTLCRAAAFLLRKFHVDRLLDVIGRWAMLGRILGLSSKPLAVDSTYYESRHVSRHDERRCRQTRNKGRAKRADKAGSFTRGDTVKRLPKLGIVVASHCHLILSLWTGTGMGADHPHFEPLLLDAWRRVPHRRFKVALDVGYDSEPNHELARHDMGLATLIPPEAGRPRKDGGPPGGRWRRHMKKLLSTKESRKKSGYTQRWQVETVNLMKRNLGSALAGKTARSRKRDLALKALTHNVMVLDQRVETEQSRPGFSGQSRPGFSGQSRPGFSGVPVFRASRFFGSSRFFGPRSTPLQSV